MNKILLILSFIFLLVSNIAQAEISPYSNSQNKESQTRFLLSSYSNKEERKFIAAVHFKLEKGWKIYGDSSSESGIGMPPKLEIKGSNIANYKIIWPQPLVEEEKIGNQSIKYHAYKDEVVLPVELTVKNLDQLDEVEFSLDYGLCKEICIPASAQAKLKLSNENDAEALKIIQNFYPKKISDSSQTNEEKPSPSLFWFILLAIFGGAILNIMPCVLPVLSIKLISILKHSEAPISQVRLSFFSTIIGILSCFVVLAFLAGIIQITGNSLGWGFQFQNPYFLIFLIVVLMFFIANLLGIFEISVNQFLSTILNKKIFDEESKGNVFTTNFLSGILAVLLATPCSAPSLGAAISFALGQDLSTIIVIFLSIGIGFAMPYIILLATPQAVYLLPKSGGWMLQIKQLMAGFLAATIVWLIYVLSDNIGLIPALLVGINALFFLLCFKIKSSILRYLSFIITAGLIFSMPMNLYKNQTIQKESFNSIWQKFDESRIDALVKDGKVVVIDITADWCLTCKFNKLRVLQDDYVMSVLRGGDLIAMRGDITKPNEEILAFMHKHGRYAIPFNIIYGPNAPQGIVVSELLTKKEFLETIKKASNDRTQ